MNQSELYGLLSSMYLCKPTREALATWRCLLDGCNEPAVTGLKTALADINVDDEQALEDILWEYTRLFIGPYKLPCPPLESVYTSPKRLMMQEAHDAVQKMYSAVGLEISSGDVMSDHIGVELNFMAVLHAKITAEPENEEYLRNLAERFASGHLRNWIPLFAIDLEKAAATQHYKEVVKLTLILIHQN